MRANPDSTNDVEAGWSTAGWPLIVSINRPPSAVPSCRRIRATLLSHLRPAGFLVRAEKGKLVFVAPQEGGSKSIDEDYSSTCRPSWSPAAVVVGRFRRRVRPPDYGPIWIGRIGCREQDRASGLRQFPHLPELLNCGRRRKLSRPRPAMKYPRRTLPASSNAFSTG